MASASTRVLIDTPRSVLVDLRQATDHLDQLVQRAIVLGNVIASVPVRAYIARRSGLPADAIVVSGPTTVRFPAAIADPSHSRGPRDLLAAPDSARIDVRANPTVPVLDVYAVARTPAIAAALANGAVDGLRDYLAGVASQQSVPLDQQVRIRQLGRAAGAVVADGSRVATTALAFVAGFLLAGAGVLSSIRLLGGWRHAADPPASPRSAADGGPSPTGEVAGA